MCIVTVIKHISEYSSFSDEELLQTFKENNNQHVLAELYLRYYELVYGVALKYLSDADLAKDAVMNIYTELLRKLPAQDVKIFRNWLYVFAKNHCLMQLRSDKKRQIVTNESEFMQSANFLHHEEEDNREQKLILLENCMKTLGEEQRKSVELFYLQRKSYNEIAEQTGMEWNKVRSLIQNGRRNLKICMEQNES